MIRTVPVWGALVSVKSTSIPPPLWWSYPRHQSSAFVKGVLTRVSEHVGKEHVRPSTGLHNRSCTSCRPTYTFCFSVAGYLVTRNEEYRSMLPRSRPWLWTSQLLPSHTNSVLPSSFVHVAYGNVTEADVHSCSISPSKMVAFPPLRQYKSLDVM